MSWFNDIYDGVRGIAQDYLEYDTNKSYVDYLAEQQQAERAYQEKLAIDNQTSALSQTNQLLVIGAIGVGAIILFKVL